MQLQFHIFSSNSEKCCVVTCRAFKFIKINKYHGNFTILKRFSFYMPTLPRHFILKSRFIFGFILFSLTQFGPFTDVANPGSLFLVSLVMVSNRIEAAVDMDFRGILNYNQAQYLDQAVVLISLYRDSFGFVKYPPATLLIFIYDYL